MCVSRSVMSDSETPWTVGARLLCPWNSPGKNTGVGCHSLLHGIFLTQDWTWVSCIAGRCFTIRVLGKPNDTLKSLNKCLCVKLSQPNVIILGCMSQSRNQDFWEKYQEPQICRWYHSNGRKWRGTKETLNKADRRGQKRWLQIQHS